MTTTDDRLYIQPGDPWVSALTHAEITADIGVYADVLANLPARMAQATRLLAEARAGKANVITESIATLATAVRELTREPTVTCPRCRGEQEITDSGSGTGFAGGSIYWTNLACGHVDMDESDDVRAAY
jgi:hypothetical protein